MATESPPTVESKEPAPAPSASARESTSVDGSELIVKILGVVGAGIGILGFVTFVGGVIIWARAEEAGLPATEAVSVVPNAVLITTGAAHLVSAVLIAFLAVGLIFIVHVWNRLRGERRVHLRRQQARELTQEAERLERAAAAAAQPAEAAKTLASTLQAAVVASTVQAKKAPDSVDLPALEAQTSRQLLEAERLCQAAVDATAAAAAARVKADDRQAAVEFEVERSEREYQVELIVGLVILLIVPTWVKGAIFHVPFVPHGLGLILAAILVPAISLFTYVQTDKFLWFGVAAFVTVGLYIGFSSYLSTRGNPKMQPVAALRTGHAPVTGAFVADSAENLYVGTFPEPGRPSRLVVIPREQLTELVLGPLLDPEIAHKRAIYMALDECHQDIEAVATNAAVSQAGEKAEVTQACSESQMKILADAARQLDQPG